jgi:hypothetical protein
MYTPAVTIVAAWISALTGVGPSIASGSQTYNGNCADFPIAPAKSSKQIHVSTPACVALSAGMFAAFAKTVPKSTELNVQKRSRMPMVNPKSPIREHEQIHVREEPVIAFLVRHVARRIDVHQQADESDHQQHHDCQMVHLQREIHLERTRHDPIEIILEKRDLPRRKKRKFADGFQYSKKRQGNRPDSNGVYDDLRPFLPEQAIDRRAGKRQRENNPEMIECRHQNFRRSTRSMFSERRFW